MAAGARRQQLIDHAIHLFATLGFRGTTTKAIAHAAGVSEAVIFRHFAKKEDLYAAILRQKADEYGFDDTVEALKRAAARGDDEGLVLRLVEHILETHRRDPDFQRVMMFATLEGHDLAKAGAAYGVPFFGFLRAYIEARQRASVFRRGDPALIMCALIALPTHFSTIKWLFGFESGSHSDRELAAEFARLILGGLRPAHPPAKKSPRPSDRPRTKRKATSKA